VSRKSRVTPSANCSPPPPDLASNPCSSDAISRSLAGALRSAGRPVTFLEIPYAEHGFDVRSGGVGEQLALAATLDFFETTLRR